MSTLWKINKLPDKLHIAALQPNGKTSVKLNEFSPGAACYHDIMTPQNYGIDFKQLRFVCVVGCCYGDGSLSCLDSAI